MAGWMNAGVQRPQGTEALMSQPALSGDLVDQRGHLSSSHAVQSVYEPLSDTESENWCEPHFCCTPSTRPSCPNAFRLTNVCNMEILLIPT